MILLYTGADSPNVAQLSSDKSLGGFVSSTPVPNGRISNIFSTISKDTVLKSKQDIRMIVLKNTTGAVITNLQIFTTTTGSHIKLKLAAMAPYTDACGNTAFESVMDSNTLPYQATLDYHELVGNAITISSFAADGLIGIWILREIDPTQFPVQFPAQDADLAALLAADPGPIEESVQLNITWN